MSNDNENTYAASAVHQAAWIADKGGLASAILAKGKCSVLELERIASDLQHVGERHAIERIDLEIMSLLERKIFRKVIAKGRRERLARLELLKT